MTTMTTTTTTILLADDHQVVLDGLAALLASEADLSVIGQAIDGLEVLPRVLELRPDVLVLDLMMPGLNGLEISRQLRDEVPETRVIILSMYANEAYVVEALRNGVAGYVLKQADSHTLLEAIRSVRDGTRYLSPPLSLAEVERWDLATRVGTLDLFDTLSTREREVLQLAAEGLTSAAIGTRLDIGRRTVETHRANIQRKLGLKTHADLVRLAVKRGLISVE